MRIISLNANGIRAGARKGFFDWFDQQDADFLCLQETKARVEQLDDPVFTREGYHDCFHDARSKKGYSGVAIYSRKKPDAVLTELGREDFDCEGRYIEARFGKLSVVSLYFPSGSSGDERQQYKFRIMDWFAPILDEVAGQRARLHDLRRLEHRAQREGHQELEVQPEELRLPARGTRLDERTDREARLGRQLPHPEAGHRGIHLVVQSRPGAGEQRRLAHRLPAGYSGAARAPARMLGLS